MLSSWTTPLLAKIEEMRADFEIYLQGTIKNEDGSHGTTAAYSWFLGSLGQTGLYLSMGPASNSRTLDPQDMDYVCQDLSDALGKAIEDDPAQPEMVEQAQA